MELIFWVPFSDASRSTFGIDLFGPLSDASRSTFGIDLLGPFSNALIRTISTFGVDLLGPLSDALIRNLNEVGFGESMFFYGDESEGRSCPFSVLHRPRGFGTAHPKGPTQWGQQAREVTVHRSYVHVVPPCAAPEKEKGMPGSGLTAL